jgi:protein-S-isoprenylcysteine O-methyltransferase Ste14
MWVYMATSLAYMLVVCPQAAKIGRGAAAKRGETASAQNQKWYDLGSVFFPLAMYIVLPLVAGLDERFSWTPNPSITWHAAGAVMIATGLALAAWAIMVNAYMWSEVPVQSGQTVCSAGPYRVIRHPGYAGLALQALGVPLLLASWWALIPGVTAAACMVIGTTGEDRLLQAGLPGYREYSRRVRFRLFPGIW